MQRDKGESELNAFGDIIADVSLGAGWFLLSKCKGIGILTDYLGVIQSTLRKTPTSDLARQLPDLYRAMLEPQLDLETLEELEGDRVEAIISDLLDNWPLNLGFFVRPRTNVRGGIAWYRFQDGSLGAIGETEVAIALVGKKMLLTLGHFQMYQLPVAGSVSSEEGHPSFLQLDSARTGIGKTLAYRQPELVAEVSLAWLNPGGPVIHLLDLPVIISDEADLQILASRTEAASSIAHRPIVVRIYVVDLAVWDVGPLQDAP